MLDLDDALDDLAPQVDPVASRDLFEQRRARPAGGGHRRRTILVAAAAALVLVLGTAAAVVAAGDRETTLQTADDPAPEADAPVPPSAVLGTVALPAAGTTGSGLLDDRTPVWVVHHADGSVSVLPALIDDGFVGEQMDDIPLAPHPAELTGTLDVVLAIGDRGFRSNDVDWDPWGRTTTHERARDLVGFAGIVVDDRVQVVASPVAPVPGEPQGQVDDRPGTLPAVPDLLPSIDAVIPGWNRLIDVYLGGTGDVFRICPYPPGTASMEIVGTQSMEIVETCDGPVVAGVTGPPGAWVHVFGEPFLVQVDESGALVGVGMVFRSGGASGTDD